MPCHDDAVAFAAMRHDYAAMLPCAMLLTLRHTRHMMLLPYVDADAAAKMMIIICRFRCCFRHAADISMLAITPAQIEQRASAYAYIYALRFTLDAATYMPLITPPRHDARHATALPMLLLICCCHAATYYAGASASALLLLLLRYYADITLMLTMPRAAADACCRCYVDTRERCYAMLRLIRYADVTICLRLPLPLRATDIDAADTPCRQLRVCHKHKYARAPLR